MEETDDVDKTGGGCQPLPNEPHADLNCTLQNTEVHTKLVTLGPQAVSSPSTQAFRQTVEENHKTWGDMVKVAGVTRK